MKYPLAKIMVMAMPCLHLAAGVADGNEDHGMSQRNQNKRLSASYAPN
jgi:hypothetical protein